MTEAILVDIDKIEVGQRVRKDLGDLRTLRESIDEVGLLHPIVLTDSFELVAGQRRLEAVRQLGHLEIEARILPLTGDEMLTAEHDENVVRLDFRPTEMVEIGRRLEEKVARQKAENEAAHRPGPGEQVGRLGHGELPHPKGSTRDIVGKAVGVSGSTYQKAKQVVEAAEANPETFGDLPDEMDQTGSVWPVHEELKARQRGQERPRTPNAHGTRVMKGNPDDVIVQKAVASLDGIILALSRIQLADLTESPEAGSWAKSLRTAGRQLSQFGKQLLKEAE